MQRVINASLVAAAAAVMFDAENQGISDPPNGQEKNHLDDKARANAVLAASALLWPVAFDYLVGYDKLGSPSALAGFSVPLGLGVLNLRGGNSATCEKRTKDSDRRAEAQSIIQAAFATGILLFNSTDRFLQQRGIRLIMFAVLLCVAIVIPQGILGDGPSGDKLVVQAMQRGALNWSIGLIIVGILTAAPPQVSTRARSGKSEQEIRESKQQSGIQGGFIQNLIAEALSL